MPTCTIWTEAPGAGEMTVTSLGHSTAQPAPAMTNDIAIVNTATLVKDHFFKTCFFLISTPPLDIFPF